MKHKSFSFFSSNSTFQNNIIQVGLSVKRTVGQKKSKKKTPYLFQYKLSYTNETGTNHHGLVHGLVIIMESIILQFDAFKFFFGVRLHGGSLPNFNFFNVNTQIFQWNRKVHLTNCLETNFHDIPNISLRDIRCGNYS